MKGQLSLCGLTYWDWYEFTKSKTLLVRASSFVC